MGPALSTTSKLLSPRAVRYLVITPRSSTAVGYRGLEPQASRQGPSPACYSHVYCCSHG